MLDAFATAGAVARESTRLAFAARSGTRPIRRRSAASLAPRELAPILEAVYPNTRIAGVRSLDGHHGTTDRARLAIEYADGIGADDPPGSVFVKAAPTGVAGRLFVNLMKLAVTEVRFYREIAPSIPVPVPHVWHAEFDEASGAFLLILEDLASRGAHFADVSERTDLETAQRAIETLGRLHAAFWNSRRFEADLSWLRAPGPQPGLRLERCLCRALVGRGVARFSETIPAEIRAAAARIVAARDRLEQAWSEGPTTLLHGDSHIGNMYFLEDAAGLLDWQVTQRGQGMRDVSYFLVNSLPTEVRRNHERELIELWRSVLEHDGVHPPSPKTAWRQYRLHTTYAWIGAAVTAAARDLQPEAIARAGISRASRALVDLDSLGALDEIGA